MAETITRIPLKRWLWGMIAVTAAVFLWLLLRPVALDVELGVADRGDVPVQVRDRGIARVRDVFDVAAPVGGRLRRVEVEVGDAVVADRTVIARLRPADPGFLDSRTREVMRARVAEVEARVAAADALVRRAQAEAGAAAIEHRRVETLARQGWMASAALDRARATREASDAGLAAARAEARAATKALAEARAALAGPIGANGERDVPVLAPVSGRVLALFHQSETVVPPGERIAAIGDPGGDLEIVAELLSSDAVRVRPGQPALIEQWGGDGSLEGVVRLVEPFGLRRVSALGIEEQRVNVWITLTCPRERWNALGHGYRVEAAIETDRAADVVRVPVPALVRVGGQWAAYEAVDGRARLRLLGIGRMNDRHAEVMDGLPEGARVILFPAEAIRDGVRIRDASA